MKRTYKYVATAFSILIYMQCFGETSSNGKPTPPSIPPSTTVDFHPSPITHKRPKAPSAQYISCVYEAGYLNIEFLIPEGDGSLSINSSDGTLFSCAFDTTSPAEVYIGEYSEAIITINTEYGHAYEGFLSLE